MLTRLGFSLGILVLAGCASERHERQAPPAVAEAPTPSMGANGAFFGGTLKMEVLLSRTGFKERDSASEKPGGDGAQGADKAAGGSVAADSGPGGGGAGDGSIGSNGSGDAMGGGMGAGGRHHRGNADASSGGAAGGGQDSSGYLAASSLPAVRLHIRLTNTGTAPVVVSVSNFDSDLGNFVIEPAKITLEPGKPIETDPVSSRLGVTSDEIPIQVSLWKAGLFDKQTLTLRILKTAEPGPSRVEPGKPILLGTVH